MRQIVHKLLLDINSIMLRPLNTSKYGIHCPKINISQEQTVEQMIVEIDRGIKFLKHPEYSYLTKR